MKPSFATVFDIVWKIFLYGKVPSGFFFCFCIFVLALSKGKLTKEDKKPEIRLALS